MTSFILNVRVTSTNSSSSTVKSFLPCLGLLTQDLGRRRNQITSSEARSREVPVVVLATKHSSRLSDQLMRPKETGPKYSGGSKREISYFGECAVKETYCRWL